MVAYALEELLPRRQLSFRYTFIMTPLPNTLPPILLIDSKNHLRNANPSLHDSPEQNEGLNSYLTMYILASACRPQYTSGLPGMAMLKSLAN